VLGTSAGSQSQNEKDRCKGSSGGDRGEQAVLRPVCNASIEECIRGRLGFYSSLVPGLDLEGSGGNDADVRFSS